MAGKTHGLLRADSRALDPPPKGARSGYTPKKKARQTNTRKGSSQGNLKSSSYQSTADSRPVPSTHRFLHVAGDVLHFGDTR